MSIAALTAFLFICLFVGLLAGQAVAFVLGGVGACFALSLWGFEGLYTIVTRTWEGMNYFILVAIPLFIFMANILERAGVADDLYRAMHCWAGPLKGGLAMGTVVICTIFAAMSGISGPATVTMGLIALPAMLKRGYNTTVAIGSIQAGGALGILIPPSITFIIFALFTETSVGRLFIGGILPGLLLSTLFITYIAIRCLIQPAAGPALPPEERATWREKLVSTRAIILPAIIVIMVLGSIFSGFATPTEAAAMGVLGALISAVVYRRLNWNMFWEACIRTLRLTAMIMWIFFGAMTFTAVYQAIGAQDLVREIFLALPGGRWGPIIVMQLSFFFLGCFLDTSPIIMITAPIYIPLVTALGFDLTWFGVIFVMNMEMAYLTPPFGFNLFYMRAVAPPGIHMGHIYRSIIPFILLQGTGLIIVMIFPQIALTLPNLVFGKIG